MSENGCVDIGVRLATDASVIYLAEAKILKSNADAEQGLRQLLDRYGTGSQGRVALLLYVKTQRSGESIESWRKHVGDNKFLTLLTIDAVSSDRRFRSTHTSEKSGEPLAVYHVGVTLFMGPTDRSAVKSEKWAGRQTVRDSRT